LFKKRGILQILHDETLARLYTSRQKPLSEEIHNIKALRAKLLKEGAML